MQDKGGSKKKTKRNNNPLKPNHLSKSSIQLKSPGTSGSTTNSYSSTDRGSLGEVDISVGSSKSPSTIAFQKDRKQGKKKKKTKKKGQARAAADDKVEALSTKDTSIERNLSVIGSEEKKLSSALNCTLRWSGECSDPEEERDRLHNYKAARRNRYSESVLQKLYKQ